MIKLFITDIDGVWTDGGMYYDNGENEWKKFNTSDSAGVLFCRLNNIEVAIITGEDTNIVKRRARKLKINHVYLGAKHKLKIAQNLCSELGCDLSEVAYIGDDINDIILLESVGISFCPSDSPEYIKSRVDQVCNKKGGEGVFREAVEFILKSNDLMESTIDAYLNTVK